MFDRERAPGPSDHVRRNPPLAADRAPRRAAAPPARPGRESGLSARPDIAPDRDNLWNMRRFSGATHDRPLENVKADYARGAHDRVAESIHAGKGEGRSLPSRLAGALGAWLGVETAGVRIHDDAFSARAAEELDANAFTLGRDIFFRRGFYAPEAPGGIFRLAHEVAHTAQQRGHGSVNPSDAERFEQQADARVLAGPRGHGAMDATGPMIMREPTFPRRATTSQMITEVERVLTLVRDTTSADRVTQMWSNVDSNFGAVTAGSIARRIWTNLFLRHFVDPESRPGVESRFPRYLYSRTFGWIDAQHFFGFIDYAEGHYRKTGDRQKAFDASTKQGIQIEKDQQTIRDYVVAMHSPDPGPARYMQVRPPNTPFFRAPVATYGALAQAAASVVAGFKMDETQGELFSQLDASQRSKFWVDSAKSAFTYEDIPSDQLGTIFFFQHGIAINRLPVAQRETAFRQALWVFFGNNQVINDQAELDREAMRWGLPGVERFLAPHLSEADVRARYPSLFVLPP
jgi:hypothetical protein